LATLQEIFDEQLRQRNQSLLDDDDELYEEYDAQLKETEKSLNKAQEKLNETLRNWNTENDLK
jgi:uncharacterized phage-like protein YoqJ